MDFTVMKRKQLQALCKKHRIPANLSNQQMALRLSLLLQPQHEKVKKVKFSPENETIIFELESSRTNRLRNRNKTTTQVAIRNRKRTQEAISNPRLTRRKILHQPSNKSPSPSLELTTQTSNNSCQITPDHHHQSDCFDIQERLETEQPVTADIRSHGESDDSEGTDQGRERGSWECVQERSDEKTEANSTIKEPKFEEALNQRLPTSEAIPTFNIYDKAGIDDASDSVDDITNKNTIEVILTSQVEVDVTGAESIDVENIESANKQVMKQSSPGDSSGSQNYREGESESTKKEAITEEKECRGADNDEFSGCKSNEDSSNATNELNHEVDISAPEFSEELHDDHKGAAEEYSSVNDDDLIPDRPLCDNGTDNLVKLIEETLEVHTMDENSIRSEDLDILGAHADLSSPSEMIQDMNVDCFIPSSGSKDKRNSERRGHTTEASEEYANDLFVEANSVSENNVGVKEIDEIVIMMEDFKQAPESQLGESSNKTAEASIKDSNEQDDPSAIIQEYMEPEIQMEGSTELDYFGLYTGKMTRVLTEDAEPETNSVSKLGLDKLFNDCEEEDIESSDRMVIEEKDKGMVADAMELLKSDDAATFDCDVSHKISGTPTAIRETMTQSDEVKFEDTEREIKVSSEATNVVRETTTQFDEAKFEDVESKMEGSTELDGHGSAFMALDNKDGKGIFSDGSAFMAFNEVLSSSLSEAKVSGDLVLDISSDDIQCKLGHEESHGCNVDDLDTALFSTHGNGDVSINESGDESLEEHIDSDHVKYGIEVLNSSPKVDKSCILDSTATEFMIDSTVCSSLTGKESECHMDGVIVPRETDSPMQGNIQLGTPDALICSPTTEISDGIKLENKTADSDADSPLFTSYELNLFSEEVQREEADKLYQRRLEENLMSETNEDMQRGITEVSIEQGYDVENEMIVGTELVEHNKLVSGDSMEIKESCGASTKSPLYDENKPKVQGSDSEGLSFAMKIAEATEVNDATAMCFASEVDVLVETEGNNNNEFEYSINFAAECGTEDSKQVESGYSEETGNAALSIKEDTNVPIFENTGTDENDDFLLEKCQQTNDTTESGGKDLKTTNTTLSLNLDVEAEAVNEENSSERSMNQSTKKVLIPASPKIIQKAHDMKENFQSGKREQIGSVSMSRKSAKRRPLEDLQERY